jgi:stress response protein SCP2
MEYFDGSAFVAYSKEGAVAITQDSFTGDGSTTAFTMSTSVTSNQAQRVVVAVGNVYQNPATAYTLSGTTITFTSAPGSSESVVVIHGFDSTTH